METIKEEHVKMSFKKNGYLVVKEIILPEVAEFVYKYFLNKRAVSKFLFDKKYISPFTEYFGVWNDTQIPNSYPIYLDPTGQYDQPGVEINLNQGDMLIYRGCDLEHWREEFKGEECCQVFLHYNDASLETAKENYLDRRPLLGAPSYFKK